VAQIAKPWKVVWTALQSRSYPQADTSGALNLS
jgi:hypothetical protein